MLRRSDGKCLFYSGAVNTVFGPPAAGKTWLALAAVVEALEDGKRAAYLDLDHNGAQVLVSRLGALGAQLETLADPDKFKLADPEDREQVMAVVADLVAWGADLVVLDSLGELLPLFGASSNSPDDFTVVNRAVPAALARRGVTVVVLDHVAKNADSQRMGATGTYAKERASDGVRLRAAVGTASDAAHAGNYKFTVKKDRQGGLLSECPHGDREPLAAVLELNPSPSGGIQWRVRAPSAGERNPDEVADPSLVATLAGLDPPPQNVREVRGRLKVSMAKAVSVWREFNAQRARGTGPCVACGEPMPPDLWTAGERQHAACGDPDAGPGSGDASW
jgi:hypothetical protein